MRLQHVRKNPDLVSDSEDLSLRQAIIKFYFFFRGRKLGKEIHPVRGQISGKYRRPPFSADKSANRIMVSFIRGDIVRKRAHPQQIITENKKAKKRQQDFCRILRERVL